MKLYHRLSLLVLTGIALAVSACSSTEMLAGEEFSKSNTSVEDAVSEIPNYTDELTTISGKGRALISEPGNSDRVTIDFVADRQLSLLTILNRIGIEGGQMLVDRDSILIYNRLDNIAQKISIYDGRMTSLNELASINILDLINFKVSEEDVSAIFESNNLLQLRLKNGARVFVNKDNSRVEQVQQTRQNMAPYSRIIYESYGILDGFTLPRKITIFSADEESRVVFLIRSLETNPQNIQLEIDIPENMVIQRL